LARIPGSLKSRATSYTRVVSSIKGHRRGWRLSFVFLPFILGGLIVQSRRSLLTRDGRSVVAELYFVFYTVALLLFPHDEGTRYVIPVAPLVFVYAAEGVRVALNGLKRLCDAAREAGWSMRLTLSCWAHRGLQVLTGVFVVGAVLYGIGKAVVEAYDQHTAMRGDGRHAVYGSAVMRVELADILKYVDANTQLTDVIMLDGAAVCHWLTGRRTADIPRSSRLSVVAEAIRRQRVTHLVVVRNSGRAESVLGPLLAQRPGDFPEVAHFGRTHVYRVGRTE